jgi:peptidoglycan/LPS O-acetylase OafA/YrhL
MSSALSHPKYRPDIDGLRAIAVFSVVIYHAFPSWLKGGFIGVDVFFVISGFLISTIIFGNLETGRFTFKDFYLRRINRIYPALLVVFLFCFVTGWFALLPDELAQLGKHIAGGAGFVSNLVLWSEAGYFDGAAELKPLLHLWSLGVEEQFYIVWPLLLWFLWRIKFNLLSVTLFLAIVSFALNLYGIKHDLTATFYSPLTRFWELLCGGLLAWVSLQRDRKFAHLKLNKNLSSSLDNDENSYSPLLSSAISFAGIVFLGFGFLYIKEGNNFPGALALLPVVGAVLIITAGPGAWFNKHVLSNKLMVLIGLISYPLYLWHWPLLSFARIMQDGLPSREIRIAAVLISIVLAWVTYRFVELPLRSLHSIKKGSILFISMIVIGCIGFYTYHKDGFPDRASISSIKGAADLFSTPYPRVQAYMCKKIYPDFSSDDPVIANRCTVSKLSPPTIAILGDSHTEHYKAAIYQKLDKQSVLSINKPSCLPFAGKTLLDETCKLHYQKMYELMEKGKSIKTVILSGYWAYLMSGGFNKGEKADNWRMPQPATAENIKVFNANAEALLDNLIKSHREVIFMRDIPTMNFNIRKCFDYRPLRITHDDIIKDCSIDEAEFNKNMEQYNSVIDSLLKKYPSIKVYDPQPVLCKNGRCVGSDGKLPYYFNGDHLNNYGARMIMDDMLKKGILKN